MSELSCYFVVCCPCLAIVSELFQMRWIEVFESSGSTVVRGSKLLMPIQGCRWCKPCRLIFISGNPHVRNEIHAWVWHARCKIDTHEIYAPCWNSHTKFLESLTPWILKWPRISTHLFGSLFVSFPSTCSCCFFNFVFWLETVIQLFHQLFDLLWRQNKATKEQRTNTASEIAWTLLRLDMHWFAFLQ